MKPVRVCPILLTLLAIPCAFSQAPSASKTAPCTLSRDKIKIPCPNGWNVLAESDQELTIGNYAPAPDTPKNVFGGRGKAFFTFSTLPRTYRDLSEWIFASTQVAPGAIESRLTLKNRANGDTKVVCLSSPEKSGTLYSSCFFQIGKTPVLLELHYGADDPKRDDYKAAVFGMVENAVLVK